MILSKILHKTHKVLINLPFLSKRWQEICILGGSCVYAFFICFFVKMQSNKNDFSDLQETVSRFHKAAKTFVYKNYKTEGEIKENLNVLRNMTFWSTKSPSFNKDKSHFSFPLVLTKDGVNLETRQKVSLDISKRRIIKKDSLLLIYQFPDFSYYLVIPLKTKDNLCLTFSKNSLSYHIHIMDVFFDNLFLFLFQSLLLFCVIMIIKNRFSRKTKVLKNESEKAQDMLFSLDKTTRSLQDKVSQDVADYLRMSESTFTLFKELQQKIQMSIPKTTYDLSIYDVFRNKIVQVNEILEEVLELLNGSLKKHTMKICLAHQTHKNLFYSDKNLIFSILYSVIQTIAYSRSKTHQTVHIYTDIKSNKLIISFKGISLSLDEMQHKSTIFCVKKGKDDTLKIIIDPFVKEKKEPKTQSSCYESKNNVIALFKN